MDLFVIMIVKSGNNLETEKIETNLNKTMTTLLINTRVDSHGSLTATCSITI